MCRYEIIPHSFASSLRSYLDTSFFMKFDHIVFTFYKRTKTQVVILSNHTSEYHLRFSDL